MQIIMAILIVAGFSFIMSRIPFPGFSNFSRLGNWLLKALAIWGGTVIAFLVVMLVVFSVLFK
jgi:hypothetical protein